MEETICALSTPPGVGGIALIRISGEKARLLPASFLHYAAPITLEDHPSAQVLRANFYEDKQLIDEVMVSVFRAPHSYTGEDVVEIACHGSSYVQQKIIEVLLSAGCRLALPGEFTRRAFFSGKLDLSQAEAVADLIHAQSQGAHQLALDQLRGGYAQKIRLLRQQLLDLVSLLELELDFSEEDVEFADRTQLDQLLQEIHKALQELCSSFSLGNVIKNGLPVAIIGKPNVGKSTLLNALLNDERAIVSDIPGTTRDTIEDQLNIEGIPFRLIDTAGLRQSVDTIENIGIARTYKAVEQAQIVLYLIDLHRTDPQKLESDLKAIDSHVPLKNKKLLILGNKVDLETDKSRWDGLNILFLAAKEKQGIDELRQRLAHYAQKEVQLKDRTLVSNLRHFEALQKSLEAIKNVQEGFAQNISSELLSSDLQAALYHMGEITGEVTSEEVLGNIFGRFCIGK